MKIRICTSKPLFSIMLKLAEKMKHAGFDHVDVMEDDHWPVNFSLRYCPSLVDQSSILQVISVLTPFNPPVEKGEADQEADIFIYLASQKDKDPLRVRIRSAESPSNADALSSILTASGIEISKIDEHATRQWHPGCNVLFSEDTTAFCAQLVAWVLMDNGRDVDTIKYAALGYDYPVIDTEDPSRLDLEPKQRFAINVNIDDIALGADLRDKLEIAGFQHVHIHHTPDWSQTNKFRVKRGALVNHMHCHDDLIAILYRFLDEHGVDKNRFPVENTIEDDTNALDPISIEVDVDLPVRSVLEGRIFSYAGNGKDRFEIVVHSEDETAAQPLINVLQENGCTRIRHQDETPSDLKEFKIYYPEGASIIVKEIAALTSYQKDLLPGGGQYQIFTEESDEVKGIDIIYPGHSLIDGSLSRRLEDPSGYNVTIKSSHPEQWQALQTELSHWGANPCNLERETHSRPQICYGAAPLPLVQRIATLIADRWNIQIKIEKRWGDDDNDIWIYLPEVAVAESKSLSEQAGDLTAFYFESSNQQSHPGKCVLPLTDVDEKQTRIANIRLPRNTDYSNKMVPSFDEFSGYCLDQRTAETLVHVASCVQLQEPCLLEGETSASKTSVIQFLAAMLGQPVVRINLNGQTDTGELIGRFVPNNFSNDLPVDAKDLQSSKDFLEDETILILDRAARESRPLNQVEIYQIMGNENILTQQWRWQDGLVPLAMKKGWWLLLDEMNLAEPQILERLNSVLEPYPSLVLTENDNSVIGRGGVAVHASFRIFSTMNPAEYSGRSVLSPAFRDRWRGYRFVPRASEQQYRQMLHFMISGEQPDVCIAGQDYCGVKHAAIYPQLMEIPSWKSLIRALAQFHTSLEAAIGQTDSGSATLGSRRKEQYVVTRRSLLSILGYLASPLADITDKSYSTVKEALTRYYMSRMVTEDDRAVVCTLLDAAGIGPNSWIVGQPEWIQLINQPINKDKAIRALQEAFQFSATEVDAILHTIPTEIDVAELCIELKEKLKHQLYQSGVTPSILLVDRPSSEKSDWISASISTICGMTRKDAKQILEAIPTRMDISTLSSVQVNELNKKLLETGIIRRPNHLKLLRPPSSEAREAVIQMLQNQPEMSAARATDIIDAIPVEIETSAMTQYDEVELIAFLSQHDVIDRHILALKKVPEQKITAIKTVRQHMDIDLREAKDIIDSIPCPLDVSALTVENREALQKNLTELGVL